MKRSAVNRVKCSLTWHGCLWNVDSQMFSICSSENIFKEKTVAIAKQYNLHHARNICHSKSQTWPILLYRQHLSLLGLKCIDLHFNPNAVSLTMACRCFICKASWQMTLTSVILCKIKLRKCNVKRHRMWVKLPHKWDIMCQGPDRAMQSGRFLLTEIYHF